MCRQRTALEMLEKQHNHGGLSKAAFLLHQKQCEDYEAMQKEVTTLKERVNGIDKKVDDILFKLDEINKQPTFCSVIKSFISNRIVQAIIAATLSAWLGGNYLPELLSFLGDMS